MKTIFLNSKKPVGGVCSSQDWSKKKSYRQKNSFLENEHFKQTPPNSKKKCIQSLKYMNFAIFSYAELNELESESESFLSKVKIYHFHLAITT